MADTFEALSRDPQALRDTIARSPGDAAGGHRLAAADAPVPRPPGRHLRRGPGHRGRAAREPAGGQPRARRRHAGAAARAAVHRGPRGHAARAALPGEVADDRHHARRPDRHDAHAEPDAALRRPARHRLQLLHVLLDVPRRPHLRRGRDRHRAARAGQAGAARAGELAAVLRRDGARQRRSHRPRPAGAVRRRGAAARPALRRGGRPATATPTASPASAATSSAWRRASPRTWNIVLDSSTPGSQGPTFKGRARIPEGQTFSAEPTGIAPRVDP